MSYGGVGLDPVKPEAPLKAVPSRAGLPPPEVASNSPPLLVPGRNCWRLEPSDRSVFLIDGEAYFRAFRDVALQARDSIRIVGWDLDTKTDLVREPGLSDGVPTSLGAFLVELLRRQPRLRIYVLNWDFAMIYALDREWLPTSRPDFIRHRRLFYQADGQHPVGASHHQKIVVIDDSIGFTGGLDLTKSRWDTSAHTRDDARRVDADGKPYAPFHDVQMMVSGEAAGALGELARLRWLNATGQRLPASRPRPVEDLWPARILPDVEQSSIGILRTQPVYEKQVEIREIQQAYLDGIKRARTSIYIESQYFSAQVIGRALASRLTEPEGPDVVLVLRHDCDGWLERQLMDGMRARLLKELELADHYGRLRVYAPTVPGTGGAEKVQVHSKVLIVDEEFVCLGSANVSNRSMGFDTECNLALDSRGQPGLRSVIASLRNRLVGEHLGVEPDLVGERINGLGSLIGAIEALRGGNRSLEDGCFDTCDAGVAHIADHLLVDPERPVAAADVLGTFVHEREREKIGRRLVMAVSVVAALGALAAAWRWTPLAAAVNIETLVGALEALGRGPLGFVTLLSGFIAGGFLAVPITLLIAVTVIAYGPWYGAPFALAGSLLSAIGLFSLGRALGRYRVQRWAGRHVAHLSHRLGERGLWAMFMVRILPIAPFSVVNLVAGSTTLSFRDFILGSALGLSPGILVTATIVNRLEEVVRKPSPLAVALLALLIAGGWAFAWYLSGRLLTKRPPARFATGDPPAAAPGAPRKGTSPDAHVCSLL